MRLRQSCKCLKHEPSLEGLSQEGDAAMKQNSNWPQYLPTLLIQQIQMCIRDRYYADADDPILPSQQKGGSARGVRRSVLSAGSGNGPQTVSYTHLDVYKRQEKTIPASPSR